jgi:hypothetical protein
LIRWALVAAFVLAACARAQSLLPACGPVAAPGSVAVDPGAWVVVPEFGTFASVFHVPPRSGEGAAAPGTLRLARSLRAMPSRVAARHARLYMLFEQPEAFRSEASPKPRAIYSIAAVLMPDRRWSTQPDDRLDVHPSLPGEGELLGFAGASDGIYALRRIGKDTPELVLDRLTGTEWRPVTLPAPLADQPAARMSLVGTPTGPAILAWQAGGVVWWGGTPDPSPATDELPPPPLPVRWASRALDLPRGLVEADQLSVVVVGGHVVLGTFAQGAWRWGAAPLSADGLPSAGAEVIALPTPEGLGALAGMVPLEHSGADDGAERAVLIGVDPAMERGTPPRIGLLEVSVRTGRQTYAGPVILASLVSKRDYALMGVVLAMVAGLIALTVISPRSAVVVLPEETSIAEPSRRIVAGLIDLALGIAAVTYSHGLTLSQVLTLEWWSSSQGQWGFAVLVLGLIVYGTLMEGAFGRTLGKFLTGCEVVSATKPGQPRRPGLTRALIRNLIKWGLPPLGVLGVLDPGGQGRADQFARTAVVSRDLAESDDEP